MKNDCDKAYDLKVAAGVHSRLLLLVGLQHEADAPPAKH